ncbi:PREDICTED: carbohydrate sulfotransferase 4-like [Nanorana parkeri]|uniref:carbohydrate sulfotransferase 4-like n=1 Tax=Nanorana parkeri TaxID=125878 RepID=UPI000854B512|nr:PREDICTED: carbohydrate sulfotransferase 4-like [Nanorana parkeri]
MWKISASKLSTFLLIAAQAAGFIFMIMKMHLNTSPVSKPEQSHLLIISSWRSGSSFTGQLFSQHPDVFYLMEPAWHVWGKMSQDSVAVLHMASRDLFRSVFHCDMSVYDAYMPQQKDKSHLFQWEASRALCSPPACSSFKRNDIIPQLSCKILCGKYPFDTIQKACKTYNVIAIKEVRVFDLKVLYPLLEDPSLNLKILHLVRDPRAIFQSRMNVNNALTKDSDTMLGGDKVDKKDVPYKVMEKVCKSQEQIYETAVLGKLDKRYMMVRYEDIVQDPLGKVKEMYEFVKLPFTPKLKDWIYNLTHGYGRGDNFIISSVDARNISRAWRTELPFKSVRRVQDLCSNTMALFGYRILHNESELRDLSLDCAINAIKGPD